MGISHAQGEGIQSYQTSGRLTTLFNFHDFECQLGLAGFRSNLGKFWLAVTWKSSSRKQRTI